MISTCLRSMFKINDTQVDKRAKCEVLGGNKCVSFIVVNCGSYKRQRRLVGL